MMWVERKTSWGWETIYCPVRIKDDNGKVIFETEEIPAKTNVKINKLGGGENI